MGKHKRIYLKRDSVMMAATILKQYPENHYYTITENEFFTEHQMLSVDCIELRNRINQLENENAILRMGGVEDGAE